MEHNTNTAKILLCIQEAYGSEAGFAKCEIMGTYVEAENVPLNIYAYWLHKTIYLQIFHEGKSIFQCNGINEEEIFVKILEDLILPN